MASRTYVVQAPIGSVGIEMDGDELLGIAFLESQHKSQKVTAESPVSDQLRQYFNNPCVAFDLRIRQQGTAFQRRVWRALMEIPPGETRTYGEIAKVLKSSPRAVGNACRRNPVPIVVPCHRVVAAQSMGGFSGDRHGGKTHIKRWLLAHEGVNI